MCSVNYTQGLPDVMLLITPVLQLPYIVLQLPFGNTKYVNPFHLPAYWNYAQWEMQSEILIFESLNHLFLESQTFFHKHLILNSLRFQFNVWKSDSLDSCVGEHILNLHGYRENAWKSVRIYPVLHRYQMHVFQMSCLNHPNVGSKVPD